MRMLHAALHLLRAPPHLPAPFTQPTSQPTSQPINQPTNRPNNQTTKQPSNQATNQPTNQPTSQPTNQPTSQPPTKLSHMLERFASAVGLAVLLLPSGLPLPRCRAACRCVAAEQHADSSAVGCWLVFKSGVPHEFHCHTIYIAVFSGIKRNAPLPDPETHVWHDLVGCVCVYGTCFGCFRLVC